MQHLDEGTIHAWLDGALAPGEASRVERHAAECDECAALVAEARGMIAGASRIVSSLDVTRGGVLPAIPAPRGRSLWRALHLTPARAALAAALLLAVGSLLTVRHTPTDMSEQVLQKIDHPEAAPAAAAVAPPPAKAKQPVAASTTMAMAPAPRHVSVPKPTPAQSTADAAGASASTAGVPAAAAMAAAPPSHVPVADSIAVARVALLDSAAHREAAVRRIPAFGQANARLEQVVVTGAAMSSSGFEGCYLVRTDGAMRDSVPERFALERPNRVRVVTMDAARDTVIRGATWRQTSATAALVSFPSGNTVPITMGMPSPSVAARFGASPPARVTVVRTDCKD